MKLFSPFCAVLISIVWTISVAAYEFQGRVIGITDGDTIIVLHDQLPYKLRLAEIDCPEKKQPFGTAAKCYCAALAFNKVVDVRTKGSDRYRRLIAFVTLPAGNVLNLQLVKGGLAWCYRQYSHDPAYLLAEHEARAEQAGLWSQMNPTPPWEFRHRKYELAVGAP